MCYLFVHTTSRYDHMCLDRDRLLSWCSLIMMMVFSLLLTIVTNLVDWLLSTGIELLLRMKTRRLLYESCRQAENLSILCESLIHYRNDLQISGCTVGKKLVFIMELGFRWLPGYPGFLGINSLCHAKRIARKPRMYIVYSRLSRAYQVVVNKVRDNRAIQAEHKGYGGVTGVVEWKIIFGFFDFN